MSSLQPPARWRHQSSHTWCFPLVTGPDQSTQPPRYSRQVPVSPGPLFPSLRGPSAALLYPSLAALPLPRLPSWYMYQKFVPLPQQTTNCAIGAVVSAFASKGRKVRVPNTMEVASIRQCCESEFRRGCERSWVRIPDCTFLFSLSFLWRCARFLYFAQGSCFILVFM